MTRVLPFLASSLARGAAGMALALCPALALCHAHPALAQPRPNATSRMSCADASALVKRQGDVVLATPAGSERFVGDRSYCAFSEIAELRFVPTRDNPQCPVGYRCKAPDFEDWNWR